MPTTSDSTPSASPIFIGGAGHSGTSLVRSILNSHPNISIGAELKATPFLTQSWNHFQRYAAHLKNMFDLSQRDIDRAFGDLITSLLEKHRRKSGKPRIGEKTPNNVFVFTELHAIFPNSPLIHVVRDGRDVVRSLLQCNWIGESGDPMAITESTEAAASYWVEAILAGERAEQKIKSTGNYLVVKYEELVANPEDVVKDICSFIDESWDPSLLEFYQQDDPVYKFTQRKITTASVGK